jgi:Icc-related predicted phosphoesterase
VIRVAAVADIHLGLDSAGRYRPRLEHLAERADLFVLAGDLTKRGKPEEAGVLADELRDLDVPTFAVLGNHDFESDAQDVLTERLGDVGVQVLEGDAAVCEVNGTSVGIAGAKGFGGGFPGACGSEFGEPEMKAFMRHSAVAAGRLESALRKVEDTDVRVAVMHYAPVDTTLEGERLEIYPFLGCYLLAEAVDRAGADLALHGHAHAGSASGLTPGGVPVRNVAQPVIRTAYRLFCLGDGDLDLDEA